MIDAVKYATENFNPRSPRGERHDGSKAWCTDTKISIHALREESDYYRRSRLAVSASISIHALREESD